MEKNNLYAKPRSGGMNTVFEEIYIWCLCGHYPIYSDGGGDPSEVVTCPDCGQQFRVYDVKIEVLNEEGTVATEGP